MVPFQTKKLSSNQERREIWNSFKFVRCCDEDVSRDEVRLGLLPPAGRPSSDDTNDIDYQEIL